MNKDLTVGSPSKVLWQFCLPMFGSILFQQLYNIADSLVAGKLIGENALAAVGNSYEITLIFLAFSFGCNIGGSVIVSRYFGAKDYNTMKTAVTTALIGTVVLCGALMAVGLLGCRSLLVLIRTPAELMDDSAENLDIYTLGLPCSFTMWQRAFLRRWVTAAPRSCFWRFPPRQTSRWTCCLWLPLIWGLPVWPGRPFCARG